MNEAVSLDVFDSTVYVKREGDFTRADIWDVDEAEIFEGSENRITMVQTYSKKFHCTYLLHSYPFDTQVSYVKYCTLVLICSFEVCYIHMILKDFDQETAQLNPNIIMMNLDLELSMYSIYYWEIVYVDDGKLSV